MANLPGVSTAKKKNGTIYYRSSITLQRKHVSLGSFDTEEQANKAYQEACSILREGKYELADYGEHFALDFTKFIILMNYRNTNIYFKTPIYLTPDFFYYYLSPEKYLIFDREDLFFYANHKLQTRGGYFFICDYGSQYSILPRYGIKNYAKKGVDYIFVNQNEYDFRYENIKIINEYTGVTEIEQDGKTLYETVIHINGNFLVGRYPDKNIAAVAYNKAVDTLAQKGIHRKYVQNYINDYSSSRYHEEYNKITMPKHIADYKKNNTKK
ncbi:MAG: hypothetical protein IJP29_01445 [Lachnospiraceae bacterium]|nr:hypothetical protein [Lachnospiraceae bacterium]